MHQPEAMVGNWIIKVRSDNSATNLITVHAVIFSSFSQLMNNNCQELISQWLCSSRQQVDPPLLAQVLLCNSRFCEPDFGTGPLPPPLTHPAQTIQISQKILQHYHKWSTLSNQHGMKKIITNVRISMSNSIQKVNHHPCRVFFSPVRCRSPDTNDSSRILGIAAQLG